MKGKPKAREKRGWWATEWVGSAAGGESQALRRGAGIGLPAGMRSELDGDWLSLAEMPGTGLILPAGRKHGGLGGD